jgi:hypothetical protein
MNNARPEWRRLMDLTFATAWMFVLLVSVIDGYLVWYCREVIEHFERNPVGQALLSLSGGHVGPFLFVKSLGTMLACMWLLVIYRTHARLGFIVVMSVAAFQLSLLIFLHTQ